MVSAPYVITEALTTEGNMAQVTVVVSELFECVREMQASKYELYDSSNRLHAGGLATMHHVCHKI